MKKIFLSLVLFFSFIFTQIEQPYPPISLVSIPTAGTLPKGYFAFENLFSKNGSITHKFSLGITNNLTLGMSYGIQNFIGDQKISKNKSYPEVQLKYRIYEENEKMPAIVVGIDTQGRGSYIESYMDPDDSTSVTILNRYEQKSLGVYFVISRNWNALGNFGLHEGMNKIINVE